MVAAKALPMLEAEAKKRQGTRTDKHPGKIAGKSGEARDQAAATTGVSARYVQDAKKLCENTPEVAELGFACYQRERPGAV